MTIRETIKKGMIDLKINGIAEPQLKARLIMQYILNKPRQYLLVYDDKTLTLRQEVDYFKSIKKLINGIPIQHITHIQEFMKMEFYVDSNVLIPRPDTEILVEEVIKIAKKIKAKKILDLCTGSGAIAVSLAKYMQESDITATDISKNALNIAKLNAKSNNVENKITFIESDLFDKIRKEKYDIIVSNPPYIKKEIINKLQKEVQNEPKIALDGGYDGLDFYRKIINTSYKYLKYNEKNTINNIINTENINLKIEETQNELNNKKIELESLNLEQKNIEPKLENLSKIEEELVNSKNKMLTLEKLNESFELTKQVIIKSYDKMKNTVTPKFTRALSNNISRITDGKYTNIIFNDEQGIIIELDNGNYIPVDKLSIGTIDQLYLSLRLSMLEELSKEYMPIILDESFAYYDTKRLKNILEYISEKFKNHQVIILTCTNREKEILEELNISYNLNIL